MAWQTPKTNWQAADVVSKDDFNRIEGNIQHLQDTKETPAGAQAKANAAEARAKAYTDQEVAEVSQALDAHLSEIATQENLGHVKVDGETITVSNGIISAQTQIVDTVTGDKWKWGMEDGIVFLEKVVV